MIADIRFYRILLYIPMIEMIQLTHLQTYWHANEVQNISHCALYILGVQMGYTHFCYFSIFMNTNDNKCLRR